MFSSLVNILVTFKTRPNNGKANGKFLLNGRGGIKNLKIASNP